jgi:hypothetical protein
VFDLYDYFLCKDTENPQSYFEYFLSEQTNIGYT